MFPGCLIDVEIFTAVFPQSPAEIFHRLLEVTQPGMIRINFQQWVDILRLLDVRLRDGIEVDMTLCKLGEVDAIDTISAGQIGGVYAYLVALDLRWQMIIA